MIEVLLEVLALKDLPRTGWVRRGIERPESVAGHSWGVAWLVLVLLPPELDRARALTYAVLHDLAEVRTGDLTPHDGVSRAEKQRNEHIAMASLTGLLPDGSSLLDTWTAYETQADPEARFVRQLDRLDMALQAVAYERNTEKDLSEFLVSAGQVIQHPALRSILEALPHHRDEIPDRQEPE